MNRLTRYGTLDAYTLEEVRREYEASDVTGRIRLLRKLYSETDRLPYEFALHVVEDPNPQVRAWIARNGITLDYREQRRIGGGDDEDLVQAWETIDSLPERNLEERLWNDPDPFVRACSFENASNWLLRSKFQAQFQKSNHFEHLAMVRNPMVPEEIIEKLFDYEDKEFAISPEERKELALAYLTNESFAEVMTATSPAWRIWELAASWPVESGVPQAIYTCVDAPDWTKAKTYQGCKKPSLRRAILSSCDRQDTETLKLGKEDSDPSCSLIALTTISKGERKTPMDEFREEVRGELQGISSALQSLQGWIFAIAAAIAVVVFYVMATRLFGGFLR